MTGAPRRWGGLLRQREFRVLWVGETTSSAGNSITAYCRPEMLGRLTASARTLAYGAIPLGALLAGGLGTLLGTRAAFWVVTSLLVAAGAVLLTGPLRHRRRLPDRPHRTELAGAGISPR